MYIINEKNCDKVFLGKTLNINSILWNYRKCKLNFFFLTYIILEDRPLNRTKNVVDNYHFF